MAIAFDNSGGSSAFRAGASSVSWSHVLGSGPNRIAIASCGGIGNAAMTITGMTFNGVAMTAIDLSVALSGNARPMGWFYLPEASLPAAGTYTVVASFSTSNTDVIRGSSVSYSGVKQTGIPVVKNANFTGGPVSSLATNVTVVSGSNWLVGFAEAQANENSITGGVVRTQTTINQDGQFSSYDSNGTVSTGSQGMTVGIDNSTYLGFFVMAIEPFGGINPVISDTTTITENTTLTVSAPKVLASDTTAITDSPSLLIFNESDTPASVVNSDYKWLTSSLKTAQLGPAFTPYFKMSIIDDSLAPNAILTSPNVPVLGQAASTPDGYIVMAGGDGSGNLKFWKMSDASATVPAGTTLVSSGTGYVATANTSIAVSDWINGSYVIDIAWWASSGGSKIIQMARSTDGGATWSVNLYSASVTAFGAGQNFYVSVGQPVFNPDNMTINSTLFYIRGGLGASSAFYKICYIQRTLGYQYGPETVWSRVADSQDWTLHSLDTQYLDGSYYIFFAGFHNWYDTPSGNSNYGIYLAKLNNITSNSLTDSWDLTKEVFISASPQVTNHNAFTFPRISTDGNLYYLIFNAMVGEGLTTSGSGSNQIGTKTNSYYYMMESADLVNFTYPTPIYSSTGVVYADTAGVTLVPQNQYYYLLGNGQNWQFLKRNIVADVSNYVINYEIQEVSGASFTITLTLGNANNFWIGTSPAGVGAAAIAIDKKIILEQGYVTPNGNETVPRNIFYIDTISLDASAPNNIATITARDINRNLQLVSTKFSYFRNGCSYYNDLFDGTTLQNWTQSVGTWSEGSGKLSAVAGTGFEALIIQSQFDNNQESSMIFTMALPASENGGYISVYPLYQDSDNYFRISVVGGGSGASTLNITLVIGGNVISGYPKNLALPSTFTNRFPIIIRKYNFHTFDIEIGSGSSPSGTYSDQALDPTGSFNPFGGTTVTLDDSFTSSVFLVSGSPALGAKAASSTAGFQPFKFLQFGASLSLQESMEYLSTISGIMDFKEKIQFFDNQYRQANYNGSYTVKNGLMLVQPSNLVINTSYPISNGEISFDASVQSQNPNSLYGFSFVFRLSNSTGSPKAYFFSIANDPSTGLVFATLYIGDGVNAYVLSSTNLIGTSHSLPIDITELHSYKVVMIDQLIYLFIDGQIQIFWQDTNFTTNSLDFSIGNWGLFPFANSILSTGNFQSQALYNQINNISFNPGDDMISILHNVLEISYAFTYSDLFGRFVGTVLNSTDASTYTYQDQLYELQNQIATQGTINEVVVTGNGVIATFKDTALIGAIGKIRSLNVTDYTITNYQDALYRAQQELINANRLNQQNNPNHPLNVGSEIFDVVTIVSTGNNSAAVNGPSRMYNQSMANNGSKGQYSMKLETGSL